MAGLSENVRPSSHQRRVREFNGDIRVASFADFKSSVPEARSGGQLAVVESETGGNAAPHGSADRGITSGHNPTSLLSIMIPTNPGMRHLLASSLSAPT